MKAATTKSITVICGPTASGKSALAAARARDTDGIVINADSLQVYNSLPILTAQPTAAEQDDIPHKLYGTLDAAERCSAQRWRDMAAAEIEAALDSGRHPVVVGGTGLYLKALMTGLSDIPAVPPEIRQRAMARQQELGNPGFHAALQDRDPVMAARLNPNDTQRLVRAYEIVEATGKSLAVWQDTPPSPPPADWRFDVTIIRPDRAVLHQRCDLRLARMIEDGALAEIETLASRIDSGALAADAPVTHALGFWPLLAYLRGDMSRDDALARAQAETRQYAKRQDTWFRHQITPQPFIATIQTIP